METDDDAIVVRMSRIVQDWPKAMSEALRLCNGRPHEPVTSLTQGTILRPLLTRPQSNGGGGGS